MVSRLEGGIVSEIASMIEGVGNAPIVAPNWDAAAAMFWPMFVVGIGLGMVWAVVGPDVSKWWDRRMGERATRRTRMAQDGRKGGLGYRDAENDEGNDYEAS